MALSIGNLATLIGTPCITFLAAWWGNHLAYIRGNREKFWDLRRQAYGIILSEFRAAETVCNFIDDAMLEGPERYFSGPTYSRDADRISAHLRTAHDRFSADYLILSDDFIRIFDGYKNDPNGPSQFDSPPEQYEKFSAKMRRWRPLLLEQARREMPLQRRRLPFSKGPFFSRRSPSDNPGDPSPDHA
jgi:hypothetical protein